MPRRRSPGTLSRPPARAAPAPDHRRGDRRWSWTVPTGASGGAARSPGAHMKTPPARRGSVDARTDDLGLLSGLTGPVRRPHRTGRQGCSKGSRIGPDEGREGRFRAGRAPNFGPPSASPVFPFNDVAENGHSFAAALQPGRVDDPPAV